MGFVACLGLGLLEVVEVVVVVVVVRDVSVIFVTVLDDVVVLKSGLAIDAIAADEPSGKVAMRAAM